MSCAEYPNSMILMNQSNETLVGKLFITDLENFEIPMWSYEFIDDEESKYKCNPSNFFIELISEKQWLLAGSIFLNLPTVDELLDEIEKDLESFIA